MKRKLFVTGLLAIIATLCAGGPAVAQEAPSTEIAGGSGGHSFLDPEPEPGTRVVEAQVRSGEYVDSVQLVYMLRDGRTITGPKHGGEGGALSVFHLDADEYLVGISGHTGSYIDSIQFLTNKRTSPLFGGHGGGRDFHIDVPANAQVTGFTGRAGEYLDAIGLTFAPLRRRFFGASEDERAGQTPLACGPGGGAFVDSDIPEEARIVEVQVHAGEYVDSVQIIYSFPNGRPLEGAKHGGGGGRTATFRLEPGEYIVGISGRCGTYVDSLRIHTNRRVSQPFGGGGGDREFRIDVPQGKQATGFAGRSGEYVDAIGLTYEWTPDPEFRFSGERRRNR
jgi:Jacalin-like lectin domain